MCVACKKFERRFIRGGAMFERVRCDCDCPNTQIGVRIIKCEKCHCNMNMVVIGLTDQEGFDDLWIDPVTKRPVSLR